MDGDCMSEQEEKGIETSAPTPVEVISVVDWDGVMDETLSDEQYVKLVVDLKPITREQADRLVEGVVVELSEEQLSFVREWVTGMLMSPESVKMIGEYMDRKAKAQQRLWGGYVSYVNGDGGEERISLMEAEERAIQDWWKDEKGEI